MRSLFSLYSIRYPKTIAYMLQATEYDNLAYIKWLIRVRDFSKVEHRRQLDLTKRAKLVLMLLYGGMAAEVLAGVLLIIIGSLNAVPGAWAFGAAIIIIYPLIWPLLIVLPLEIARIAIVKPNQQAQIKEAEAIFANHKAVKIAVAGSYGKTSMKEILKTTLSEGYKVAATEANKNVAVEHAKFARRLSGSEDVLIIEYGEGEPGDVKNFASNTHPTMGVITGIAPAHLNKYPSLKAAGEDIFSLAEYLKGKNVYVNADSTETKPFIKLGFILYGSGGAGEFKAQEIKVDITGTSFALKYGSQQLKLHSSLIGRHQVGPLSLAALIGLSLGLSKAQVTAGIAKSEPFEHRMQPYALAGAWIIDDTYNGNIDGIRAGVNLLKELKFKRKIYVTPGLVDQGEETVRVHREMGRLIALAKPDIVVLMQNSVTKFIQEGLSESKFSGEVRTETNPLRFYTNLDRFVASGDLVLMQNDWPDNYA